MTGRRSEAPSLGERQRIAIVGAIVVIATHDPRLIDAGVRDRLHESGAAAE